MTDDILFGGMRYVSAADAAVSANLTRDYIARLCRDGKVQGRRIGKNWYVEPTSLSSFLKDKQADKATRNENLSKQRKQEYQEQKFATFHAPTVHVPKQAETPVESAFKKLVQKQEHTETPRVLYPDHHDSYSVPKVHTMEHAKRRAAYRKAASSDFRHAVKTKIAHAAAFIPAPTGVQMGLHDALSHVTHGKHVAAPVMEFAHRAAAMTFVVVLLCGLYAAVNPGFAEFVHGAYKQTLTALAGSEVDPQFQEESADSVSMPFQRAPENGALAAAAGNPFTDFFSNLGSRMSSFFAMFGGDRATVTLRVTPIISRPIAQAPAPAPRPTPQQVQQTIQKSVQPTTLAQAPRERIIERVTVERIIAEGGISESLLNSRLSELENRLNGRIDSTVAYSPDSARIYQLLSAPNAGGSGSGSVTNVTNINGVTTFVALTDVPSSLAAGDILYADVANHLAALPAGTNGLVLKLIGGFPTWQPDLQGSGGAGAWATTTDNLAVYTADPSHVVLVGNTATTTAGNILEVRGNSLFRGTIVAYNAVTSPNFVATSTTASVFPYASTTAITATTASTTNLVISSLTNGILKVGGNGAVTLATPGTDYVSSNTGDWVGTLSGYTAAQLIATGFSTTSADYYANQRNFFSTTSADYLASQRNFFSTTSASHFLSLNQSAAFSTTSASYFLTQNNSLAFSTTSNDFWQSQRNFFSTTSADHLMTQRNYFSTSSANFLLTTYDKGYFFSTTSSDYWKTANNFFSTTSVEYWKTGTSFFSTSSADYHLVQVDKGFFFSTTSTDYYMSLANVTGFSTTSADYWKTFRNFFSTTSAEFFANASTTIPKTYSANTFTALQTFGNASSTYFSASYASSTLYYGAGLATCAGGEVLTYANGRFSCVTDQTATGQANAFTWLSNYGVVAAATTSPIWAQNGIFASSTSHFADADFANATTTSFAIANIGSGSLLKVGPGGAVQAAVAGTDYAAAGSGFSTTSADFWQTQRNFFSTTSASFWASGLNFFSTTSADYHLAQIDKGYFFSTTSADFFLSQANVSGFSTTSANYWKSVTDLFATTSTIFFANASTTIPKTYTNNAFTGYQTFSFASTTNASTTLLSASYASTTQLFGAGLNTCEAGNFLTWGNGRFGCSADTGGSLSVFTWFNTYGTTTAATTSSIYTVGAFYASSTVAASQFPYASSTAFTTGNLFAIYSTTTQLGISAVASALLSTDANGTVIATTSLASTYLSGIDKGFFFSTTSADSWKLSNNFFSTTSADFFASQRNFFSTSSADYWKLSNNFFATTSADYLLATYDKGFFFSTTSSNYWKTANNFFSTTSADYWKTGLNFFSTTSADFYANASTTIPKTYSNNTFTGNNIFNGTLTFGTITGPLQAVNGVVSGSSTIASVFGGTGFSSFSAGDILYANAGASLSKLAIGAPGEVLKVTGGFPAWGTDLASGGGSGGTWSTTTSQTAGIFVNYPNNASDVVAIGSNSTTTAEYWFDPNTGMAVLTGTTILSNVSATNATTTSLAIANIGSGSLLKVSAGGAVTAAIAGSDYLGANTTLFSTTSADFFVTQRNFFSTTSSDYWKSITDFFSTTSASYFLALNQSAAFSTTSADFYVNASSTIPKTYSNNTFTGNNIFNGTLTFVNATGTSIFTQVAVASQAAFGATGTTTITNQGRIGVGTTSPFALISIAASPTTTPGQYGTLFSIASSTATTWATTTLFSISNTGTITTALANALLSTDASGSIVATTSLASTYLTGIDKGFFFSTTSADYFLSQANISGFSTTSADFWKTQRNFFATTSADYLLATYDKGFFFSTTSSDYWKTANNFFSTTSAAFWASGVNFFSTTSATYFADASTTIPKTYTANTFSALQTFGNASSTYLSATYASTTQLFGASLNTCEAGNFLTWSNGRFGCSADTGGSLSVFTWFNTYGTTTAATTSSIYTVGAFYSSSTVAASQFPYASSTAFSASNLFAVYSTTTQLGISGVVNALLSTDGSGTVVATTSLASTYLTGIDKGFFFSTTSADAWKLTNNFFSTTSADFFASQRNFFSTTSSDFWKLSNNFFATTSAIYFVDASSTIAKTYFANTFTALQTFNGASTTAITATTASTTNLILSSAGGAGTRCVQVGPDGTLSASASACGTGAGGSSGFSIASTFGTTTAATTSSIWTQGVFFSSSTVAASQFPYASSTALTMVTGSTTNLFVSSVSGALLKTDSQGKLVAALAGVDYLDSGSLISDWEVQTGMLVPTSTIGLLVSASSTFQGGLYIDGSATTTNNLYVGNRLGVGTAGPEGVLDVRIPSGAEIYLGSDNIQSTVQFTNGSIVSNGGLFRMTGMARNGGTAPITIEPIEGFESIRLDGSNGNVGIWGITAPKSNLDVAGNVSIGSGYAGTVAAPANSIIVSGSGGFGTSTPNAYLAVQSPSSPTKPVFNVATSSHWKSLLTVASDGFGTTSVAGLNINGAATSTSNVGFNLTGGCFAVNGSCLDASTFGISTFAYPFTTIAGWGTGAHTTSTPLIFTGGFASMASTTIGNGTQGGGLTVSGGATTTGNAYFAGNVGIGSTTPWSRLSISTVGSDVNPLSIRTNASPGNYTPTNSGIFMYDAAGNETLRIVATDPNLVANYNSGNLFIGARAGETHATDNVDAGYGNTALGYYAFRSSSGVGETSFSNTAVGSYAMEFNTEGYENTALGASALADNVTGNGNVAVGQFASGNNISATNTVAIGNFAGGSTGNFSAQGYTLLGANAGRNITTGSDFNTFLGFQSGSGVTSGYGNILLGPSVTANNLSSGSGNIGIGYNTFFPSATGNRQLNIGGLLFGSLPATSTGLLLPTSGTLGIGTTSPWAKFSIQTNNDDTATTLFAIGSSTVSATTTLFSISNTGLVTGLNQSFTNSTTTSLAITNIANSLLATNAQGSVVATTTAGLLTNIDKGFFFSTTSADFFVTQRNFFSTTSSDYWKSITDFFSTTSASYFLALNQSAAFSTTSADFYVNASSTIPKTYSNNTFTGNNIFNGTLTFVNATGTSIFTQVAVASQAAFGATGTTTITNQGRIGVGTTSPFALISIAASPTTTPGQYGTLFSIASSTADWATTTLLSVLNTGNIIATGNFTTGGVFTSTANSASVFPYASSTAITVSGTASTSLLYANGLGGCSVGQYLTWSNGSFGCSTDQTTAGANPFAWLTHFSTSTVAATTSSIWTQGVFFSSSTIAASQLPYASSTAQTIGNIFGTYATFTGATTSALFVNGSTTIAGALNVSGSSIFNNISFLNATNTNLYVGGTLSAGGASFGGSGTTTISRSGYVGIGTTTPWAPLSINASPTTTPGLQGVLFSIASSTSQWSTSTLLSIDNTGLITGLNFSLLNGTTTSLFVSGSSTLAGLNVGNTILTNATSSSLYVYGSTTIAGNASTTGLFVSNLGSTNCDVKAGPFGALYCGTDVTSAGANDFAWGTLTFGTSTAATTTSIWTQGVFFSSSTVAASQFPYASSTAFTTSRFFFGDATGTSLYAGGTLSAANAVFGGSASSTFTSAGRLGIGSSTPWAQLSIQTSNTNALTAAFNISSSSPFGPQISLFNINNRGQVTVGGGASSTIGQLSVMAGTSTIKLVGSTGASGPNAIYVQGQYAYTVDQGANGMYIYDVSNPAAPSEISYFNSLQTGSVVAIHVSGRYAYLGSQDASALTVIDVSNPEIPVQVGYYHSSDINGINGIYVQGKYAYITTYGTGTMVIVDVSDPARPFKVGSVEAGEANKVHVQGNFAYVTDHGGSNLVIFDVSNPAAPVQTGFASLDVVGYASDLYVQGKYAYVTDDETESFVIFDVSDPTAPVKRSSVTGAPLNNPAGIYVQGRYAYIAGGHGLATYDVSDPVAPRLISENFLAGTSVTDVFVQGRYAYTSTWFGGSVSIFDLGGAYVQQLEAGGIEAGTLAVRNNLFADNAYLRSGLNVGNSLAVNGSGAFTMTATTSLSSLFALSASKRDNNVSSVSDVLSISKTATGTISAGIGTGLLFQDEYSNNASNMSLRQASSSARIASVTTNISTSSPAADLAFYTKNGNTLTGLAERMRLSSVGNLGIGTTSPFANLSVQKPYGSVTANLFAVSSSTASDGSAGSLFFKVDNTGTTTIAGNASTTGLFVSNLGSTNCDVKAGPGGALYCGSDANSGATLFTWANTYATNTAATTTSIWTQGVFFSSSTVAASQFPYASSTGLTSAASSYFATVSGAVGIGTTTLRYNTGLNVFAANSLFDSNSFETTINIQNYSSGGRQYALVTGGTGGAMIGGRFGIYDVIAGAARLTVDSSGNVGIGTSTPQFKLQATTASAPQFAVNDGNNTNGWSLRAVGGNFYFASTSPLTFATSTVPGFTILGASGNFGIATSSPYAKLSVAGAAAASYFDAYSTTSTSTFAGGFSIANGAVQHDFSSGLTSIDNLVLGTFTFDSDAGVVTWADMPVTSAASQGTVESYSARIDGTALLSLYSESDGAGGILGNFGLGVGSTSPWGLVSIEMQASTSQRVPAFVIADQGSTSPALLVDGRGYLGLGTTTPNSRLSINPQAGETYALAIGSSTASLFTVDTRGTTTIRGNASTTGLFVSNLGSTNCDVKAGPFGALYCGTDATTAGANPFTWDTLTFGTSTAATTTSIWTRGVFYASSTVAASQFPYASTTAISVSGTASTTNLFISGIAVGSTRCLNISATGLVGVAAQDCGTGSGGGSDFSFFTVNGIPNTAATSSPFTVLNTSYFGAIGTTTITGTGRLGVGTTSPFAMLSVHALNGATTTSLFRVASSTASQTTTLFDISNAGVTTIGDTTSTGDAVMQFGNDINAWTAGYNSSDKTFRIASSTLLTSDVAVSIKKEGASNLYFGIASSTPWKTLSVQGNAAITGLSTVGATTTAMSNVCIDNTTGELIRSTVFVGCTGSSERFKSEIATLATSSLDIIRQLHPKSFVYKNDTSSTTVWGFIAEEAYAIDPHLAAVADGVVYNIMDRAITAVTVEAIQALDLRLESISTTSTSTLGLAVTAGTSTTASSTDAVLFGHAFFQNIFARIAGWLGEATNGIAKIFTKELYAESVDTKELCLSDASGAKTCITKSELDSLLQSAAVGAAGGGVGTGSTPPPTPPPPQDPEADGELDLEDPAITIQGANPATIDIGDAYSDLGATATDNVDQNLSIKATVDAGPLIDLSEIVIDTSVAGDHSIIYSASDAAGNVGIATRVVHVVDPQAEEADQPAEGEAATTTPLTPPTPPAPPPPPPANDTSSSTPDSTSGTSTTP